MRAYLIVLAVLLLVAGGRAQESRPQESQSGSPTGNPTAEFSEQDANQVLRRIKQGAESHDLQQILSAFDGGQTDGYLTLEGQADEFVRRYDPVRFYYRILQTSTEGAKGIATVEIQMEAEPRDSNGVAIRRDQQFRFEFTRAKKSWKITAFAPAQIFTR